MSSDGQVQEAASSSLNVLRRLTRPTGRVAPNEVDVDPPSKLSKPTPFKRLKSHLGKTRSSSFKEKVERSPPQTPPTLEPQSDETTTVAQNTGSSCDPTAVGNDSGPGEHDTSPDDDSQTLPTTLARRIHSLLSPFPSHYTLTPSGSFLPPQTSDQCGAPDSANADSTFFSLLSSVPAMNGSISKGRESVWAALERLRYLPHLHPKEDRREQGEDDTHDHESEPDVGMSSVMICGPLQPTEDTEVELARSEVVSIEETYDEPAPVEQSKEQRVVMIRWPFGTGKRRADSVSPAEKALPPPPPITQEVRVWYPSRTKVSLQAFWWGYRIYLPPPVMRVLSDKSLEAAKRAAMITAALTWLVSHLPTTVLPLQMRAVFGVLKQIAPIMGYVGGFIAWSWNTVQGFDKGQGVTLSATWLLPIALVPGTWFYTEPLSSGEPSVI